MRAFPGWAKSRAIAVAAAMVVTGCQLLFGDFQFTTQDGGVGGFVGSISAAGGSSLPSDCSIEGAARCNGSMLELCSSKRWVGERDCITQSQCDADHTRCKECVPNSFRCDAFRLMQCTSNGENWNLYKACDDGASCDAQNGRCTKCAVDEAICYQGLLQLCNADRDGWGVTDCGNVNRCRTSPPPSCGPCAEGEYQCNGSQLQRCNDRLEWDNQGPACATAALCTKSLTTKAELEAKGQTWNGTCELPACTSGEFRCNPDNKAQLQACPPTQQGWENVGTPCLAADLCDPVAGKCKDGCEPGSYKCDGNRLLHCGTNGQFDSTPQATCATAAQCSVSKHACLDCIPGEFQCDGAKLQQCTQTQTWDTVNTCTTAALCDATVKAGGKTCQAPGCLSPNTQRCNPEHPNELQYCPATQVAWVPLETCLTAGLCDPNRTTCVPPTCNVGDTRCTGQSHQVCSTDRTIYVTDKTCPSGQVCDLAKGCATCTSGQQRCNGATIEVCKLDSVTQALSWQPLGKTCPTKDLCKVNNYVASCDAVTCDVGEHDCPPNSSVLNVCNAGRNGWNVEKTCGVGQICDESGGQCDICVPNTYACNGSSLMKCSVDGQSYATVQNNCVECSTSTDKSTANCYVCQTNNTRCNGTNRIERCASDRKSWVSPTTCANSYDCVRVDGQNDYCAVCPVANEVACDQTSSPGSTHKCPADRKAWSSSTKCTQGFGCVSVNPGDDYCASACSPNEVKCADSTSVHTCDAEGKGWGASTSECADTGSLKACTGGTLSTTTRVACPSNAPNCVAGRCVACVGTNSSCADSNTSQTCQDGNWKQNACGTTTPYCVGEGTCVECTANSTASCPTASSRKYCSANAWTTEACVSPTPYCQSGQCVACTNSSTPSCASPSSRTYCSGSNWVTEDCPALMPACFNGICGECNASTPVTCENETKRKYCMNGGFALETCSAACVGGKCVECGTGAPPTCATPTQAKACVNNAWELTNCTGATPVCVGGSCVECANDTEWSCDSSDATLLKRCLSHTWQTSHCAAPTGYCASGVCVGCLPDNTGCGADQVCVSGACVPKDLPDAGVDAGQTGAAGSG
ncbi:MAG TPA: hypothetical protein VIV60_30630 [Polyangiaceae bacterium]